MKFLQNTLFAIVAATALLVLPQTARAQGTALGWDAAEASQEAWMSWRENRSYFPSSTYSQQTYDYSYRAYLKAVYTYYGYNIRPGGTNPMTNYDRMWCWADVARDADLAYQWFAAGIERNYIRYNSRSARTLVALWESKLATQEAADEAFDIWYDNFSW